MKVKLEDLKVDDVIVAKSNGCSCLIIGQSYTVKKDDAFYVECLHGTHRIWSGDAGYIREFEIREPTHAPKKIEIVVKERHGDWIAYVKGQSYMWAAAPSREMAIVHLIHVKSEYFGIEITDAKE